MTAAIEVRALSKRYGDLAAVDGISFRVTSGTVFAFLGPNGAGKTTTTEILEGLRRRSSGEVEVLGLDPWEQGDRLHRQVGVIPQDFRFFEKITPAEAILYYGALFGTRPETKRLLDQVKLLDKADARFDTLSGGQKQKLGLALSLANDPALCFLDEPTTGLDPSARRAIWEVIRSLRREGRTVFLTTHYLEEAELLADRVAIIDHGHIVAEGTPQEIIRGFGRPERLRVEGPPELAGYLQRELGLAVLYEGGRVEIPLADPHDSVRVLNAIAASGLPWRGFTTAEDTLEDVFIRLVGRTEDGDLSAAAGGRAT